MIIGTRYRNPNMSKKEPIIYKIMRTFAGNIVVIKDIKVSFITALFCLEHNHNLKSLLNVLASDMSELFGFV